jgi:hypothetical protein
VIEYCIGIGIGIAILLNSSIGIAIAILFSKHIGIGIAILFTGIANNPGINKDKYFSINANFHDIKIIN